MKRSVTSLIWGIVFIAVGVILMGNILGFFDISIFFRGWWTLFIIVPCFIGLFSREGRTGSFIGLGIGIMLLLAAQDWIEWSDFGKLVFPFILVVVGCSIIGSALVRPNAKKWDSALPPREGRADYSVVLSGRVIHFDNEVFLGATLSSILGSLELNLRNAIIREDVRIDANLVLGGINIYVPNNVKVIVNSTPILGGVDNGIRSPQYTDGNPVYTIYVNATCVLGGIDIK